ncbi:MAG: hypothetical protein ACLFVP_06485 [Candidatus Bathyarchaeia archaeon]
MTHTHHRRGSRESLEKDYVILSMVDSAVEEQQEYNGPLDERVKRFLEICRRHKPVALLAKTDGERLRYLQGWKPEMDSGSHTASKLNEVANCDTLADEGIGHAVYTDADTVRDVLGELKKADLGISIVVSGIFDEVFEACREAGLKPHTVNMSLGAWGKTELLPETPVIELCTMCGHAMISSKLAEHMIEKAKRGEITPTEAAVELGKQCTCNIFNTERAVDIIKQQIKGE